MEQRRQLLPRRHARVRQGQEVGHLRGGPETQDQQLWQHVHVEQHLRRQEAGRDVDLLLLQEEESPQGHGRPVRALLRHHRRGHLPVQEGDGPGLQIHPRRGVGQEEEDQEEEGLGLGRTDRGLVPRGLPLLDARR